jgi:DNA primase
MQDPVAEIKNKLSIEDLVAPYVQLKQAGKYLKAPCPFHQEKTPSFFVSPERQLAYCFSCQKGGDMFQFIQDIEGLDFRGALELLADKASVELPKFSGQKARVSKDVKDRLKSANRGASNFFVQSLHDDGPGAKVLSYLKNRGMTDETIRTFEVGFAPDSKDALYRYLLEKKHEKDDLLECHVVLARDSESKNIMDRFRLRLMFPIDSAQGDIVGFGGRALKKGDQPKYLNSPEYVLYHKGRLLYNLSRAKADIREKDLAICVEGYFDVMASTQAGAPHVVASSGTALTEEQFKLLKRYTKRIALAFDADSAGQEALLRAVQTAQPLDLEIFVVTIAGGKDAADLVKENPKLWLDAVEAKLPYMDFFIDTYEKRWDLSQAEGKRHFTDAVLALLKGVKHPVERDHYLKKLSGLVGTPIDMLYDYLNQMKHTRKHKAVKSESLETKVKKSREERCVFQFISLLLVAPQVFFDLWKELETEEAFKAKILALPLVERMDRLEASEFKRFYENFEEFIGSLSHDLDASSVYKKVRDHYNLHAELDEAFYASVDDANHLQKIAFEAETKVPKDEHWIEEEFTKLIAHLCLFFIS